MASGTSPTGAAGAEPSSILCLETIIVPGGNCRYFEDRSARAERGMMAQTAEENRTAMRRIASIDEQIADLMCQRAKLMRSLAGADHSPIAKRRAQVRRAVQVDETKLTDADRESADRAMAGIR